MKKIAILVVCHANICRSPMAEGILKQKVAERGLKRVVKIDSAGTHAGFLSSRPDLRAQKISLQEGINIRKLRSRKIKVRDFKRFDHILAMDLKNLNSIIEICPEHHRHKVSLLLSHLPQQELSEVPDPYYGSEKGFERVFQLMAPALTQFLDKQLKSMDK